MFFPSEFFERRSDYSRENESPYNRRWNNGTVPYADRMKTVGPSLRDWDNHLIGVNVPNQRKTPGALLLFVSFIIWAPPYNNVFIDAVMTVSSRYRGGLKPITFRRCIYFIDSVPHYLESKCDLHLFFFFFFVKFTSKEGYVVAVNCKTTGTWHAPTPPSKHVGHGVWKVPCWVLGDKDYFCSLVSGRETSRKGGRWTLIRLS